MRSENGEILGVCNVEEIELGKLICLKSWVEVDSIKEGSRMQIA